MCDYDDLIHTWVSKKKKGGVVFIKVGWKEEERGRVGERVWKG